MKHRILIDAREFTTGRVTGIAKVLQGLITALAESPAVKDIDLVASDPSAVSEKFCNLSMVRIKNVSTAFFASERTLSSLTKEKYSLFLSPYPKLPLFGCCCKSVNTIHDVLDLTHPAYRRRLKVIFDKYRLRRALRYATMTWYDSEWSLKETRNFAGGFGKNPRVRYPGIDDAFTPEKSVDDEFPLKKYGLEPGYVMVIGNGLPHKNLGVLLEIAQQMTRRLVFVGVQEKNRLYWKSRYPDESAIWISHVKDGDLPSLLRAAFCLAQPSTAEGYGYPPLEAMACGIPAVVSSIPVLLETTGSVALYADPHNPGTWIEALRALEKDEIYEVQVEKGLKWVESLKGIRGWQGHVSDIQDELEGRS